MSAAGLGPEVPAPRKPLVRWWLTAFSQAAAADFHCIGST